MKKVALLCAALVFSAVANEPEEFEGLLTTPACAAQGAFADCYLENYVCGSDGCFRTTEAGVVTKEAKYALYQHNTGKVYTIDTSKLKLSDMRDGINKNGVVVLGTLDVATNTINATEFKSPPPPKKSFFKGCL
jgi:hypothetical protein